MVNMHLIYRMTVRYEWHGTGQDARPAVSGLVRLCRQRKGCVPHAVSDLTLPGCRAPRKRPVQI